jgi:hypothetical protein
MKNNNINDKYKKNLKYKGKFQKLKKLQVFINIVIDRADQTIKTISNFLSNSIYKICNAI